MSTHRSDSETCRIFDSAQHRLAALGLTLKSDGEFFIYRGRKLLSQFEQVDGLVAFADAVEAQSQAPR